jgi:hypothetical protein
MYDMLVPDADDLHPVSNVMLQGNVVRYGSIAATRRAENLEFRLCKRKRFYPGSATDILLGFSQIPSCERLAIVTSVFTELAMKQVS